MLHVSGVLAVVVLGVLYSRFSCYPGLGAKAYGDCLCVRARVFIGVGSPVILRPLSGARDNDATGLVSFLLASERAFRGTLPAIP